MVLMSNSASEECEGKLAASELESIAGITDETILTNAKSPDFTSIYLHKKG